jgi:hypothetical protein
LLNRLWKKFSIITTYQPLKNICSGESSDRN